MLRLLIRMGWMWCPAGGLTKSAHFAPRMAVGCRMLVFPWGAVAQRGIDGTGNGIARAQGQARSGS